MSFEKAFATVLQHEGGWSNNPRDKGGETYMGISRNRHPDWEGWPIVDQVRQAGKALSLHPDLPELVRAFYRKEFWMALHCHHIDPVSSDVAEELFEAAVNCGPSNGIKFLQRALNALNARGKMFPDLVEDGGMGPTTLRAVLTCLVQRQYRLLVKCQNGEQYLYYKQWSQHEDFPGVFQRT